MNLEKEAITQYVTNVLVNGGLPPVEKIVGDVKMDRDEVIVFLYAIWYGLDNKTGRRDVLKNTANSFKLDSKQVEHLQTLMDELYWDELKMRCRRLFGDCAGAGA